MKRCVIIMNPESGRKNKQNLISMFNDTLVKYGYSCEIILTNKKGDGYNIIKSLRSPDLVISAGGDGTLNEVISGNLARKNKLLIAPLPLGTTNDVGSMYGYTRNIKKDLELILSGKEKEIDVCLINGKPFLYVGCIGSFVNVPYETPRKLKKQYGKLAYAIYGMKQLKNKINRYKVTYKIDDKEYNGEYSFIFITNTSRVGGFNNVFTDIKLDDKKFEVALCDIKTKAEIIPKLYTIISKDIRDVPGVTYFKTDNIDITFDEVPESSWCLDGEEYKHNEKTFKFSICSEFKMLVPKKNLNKLFESQ